MRMHHARQPEVLYRKVDIRTQSFPRASKMKDGNKNENKKSDTLLRSRWCERNWYCFIVPYSSHIPSAVFPLHNPIIASSHPICYLHPSSPSASASASYPLSSTSPHHLALPRLA